MQYGYVHHPHPATYYARPGYAVPYANLLAADKNGDGVIDAAEYVDGVATGKLPGVHSYLLML